MSLPSRIALRTVLNIVLVWALAAYLPQYLTIVGGIPAFVIIGALLTLLNILVRPLLDLVTLPLKLVATILAFVLANGVFLWLVNAVAQRMDPSLVVFRIERGLGGWIVLMLVFGLANWTMKVLLK
ncbi:MAG: phage holin family protein [Candidatus Peribacteraceae bacterium]|nr:phage holin family protein [Candidatus Peribacteraceae bacterium]